MTVSTPVLRGVRPGGRPRGRSTGCCSKCWEALVTPGSRRTGWPGTATGVFAGLSYAEYMERLGGQPEELEGSVLANGSCVAGGRISYLLGLNGPCLVLDTACSSSLVALHLACQSTARGGV